MHWTANPIYVIDFEGNTRSGVVEYGVVSLLGGEVVDARTRICRSLGDIPERERRVHGIASEDTIDTRPFADEWELFSNLRKRGPFCAHYARVEHSLIKSVWPYPPFCQGFINRNRKLAEWGPWIDTCVLYAALFPDLPSYRLRDLVSRFHLTPDMQQLSGDYCPEGRGKYHCALFDALSSACLLINLSRFPGFENITVSWLLKNSAAGIDQRDDMIQEDMF